MNETILAKSYWRSVKRDARSFEAVPDSLKDRVMTLAAAEVEAGTLTESRYAELIGEVAHDADTGTDAGTDTGEES